VAICDDAHLGVQVVSLNLTSKPVGGDIAAGKKFGKLGEDQHGNSAEQPKCVAHDTNDMRKNEAPKACKSIMEQKKSAIDRDAGSHGSSEAMQRKGEGHEGNAESACAERESHAGKSASAARQPHSSGQGDSSPSQRVPADGFGTHSEQSKLDAGEAATTTTRSSGGREEADKDKPASGRHEGDETERKSVAAAGSREDPAERAKLLGNEAFSA
jgi:hypothetical protein